MSRYITTKSGQSFSYGFDNCGIPGYFLSNDESDYDTRAFMADEDCCLSRGQILDMMNFINEIGGFIPQAHIDAIALDLPF